jgi:enterochelin esterase family protein
MTVAERLVDHLHPELAALRDDPSGAAEFWSRLARDGAPLVEPDPRTPGHSIVTFVFPLPPQAKHVAVNAGYGNASDHVLDRIPGTDVGHAAYRYRDDVRLSYAFAVNVPLVPYEEATATEIVEMLAYGREHPPLMDPHHREHFPIRVEGQPDRNLSFVSLPDAPDQSVLDRREGAPHGQVHRHRFTSEILGNERRIWVYTPPGYDASGGQTYPVLAAFDGGGALTLTPLHRMLDNLIADGRVRPMVALFIDNATETSRQDDLPCSEPFAQFVETELLPWLRANYRVSHEAKDHAVTGVSYGGLAAMWFGYRLPHVFGTVISQAASLWWGPGWDMSVRFDDQKYATEWLIEQYAASPRLPVRFWMEIGLMEHPSRMLPPNRRMKSVLEAKGYDLTYSEPAGGHDYALWRGTLADALTKMLPAV